MLLKVFPDDFAKANKRLLDSSQTSLLEDQLPYRISGQPRDGRGLESWTGPRLGCLSCLLLRKCFVTRMKLKIESALLPMDEGGSS
jgi:hypothetical protein